MTKALLILAALILGLLAGIGFGQIEAINSGADTIGSVWLNALRMTVVPLVVALLITGMLCARHSASLKSPARFRPWVTFYAR
jgi:proton glutamate symport protein